jgi:hypothetical protein
MHRLNSITWILIFKGITFFFEVIYVFLSYNEAPLLLPIVFVEFDNLKVKQYFLSHFYNINAVMNSFN